MLSIPDHILCDCGLITNRTRTVGLVIDFESFARRVWAVAMENLLVRRILCFRFPRHQSQPHCQPLSPFLARVLELNRAHLTAAMLWAMTSFISSHRSVSDSIPLANNSTNKLPDTKILTSNKQTKNFKS